MSWNGIVDHSAIVVKAEPRTMKQSIYATGILLTGLFVGAHGAMAQAQGDPKIGKNVFIKCSACHSLEAGKNGVGPSLNGLFGRKSGHSTQLQLFGREYIIQIFG